MLNKLVTFKTSLFSALEQFEVIPFINPEYWAFCFYNNPFYAMVMYNNVTLNLAILFGVWAIFSTNNDSITYDRESVFLNYSLIRLSQFVYSQILDNLSVAKHIYFLYTFTLFTFVLTLNVLGLLPYSLTVSSYLIITLLLSGMSFFGNLIITLRVHGMGFFKFFVPSGVSEGLLTFLVIVELISYVTRLFSMAIRLFANMLSGHALVKILSGLLLLTLESICCFGVFSIIFNIVILAVTALEVIVAVLQAYVFVVLSTVYTNEAILLH